MCRPALRRSRGGGRGRPAWRFPITSTRSPSAAPFFTSTHSARPSRSRITNVRSLVVTTLVLGTNSAARPLRTGHLTVGYIPGASEPSRFDDVELDGHGAGLRDRARAPSGRRSRCRTRSGKAGTRNGTLAPRAIAPASCSGTATTRRSRETCCEREQRRPWRAGERAGVRHALGHDAVERRGDAEVRLHVLLRLRGGRCAALNGLRARLHDGAARPAPAVRPGPARCRRSRRAFRRPSSGGRKCSARRRAALRPACARTRRPAPSTRPRRSAPCNSGALNSASSSPCFDACCRDRPERARRSPRPGVDGDAEVRLESRRGGRRCGRRACETTGTRAGDWANAIGRDRQPRPV